VAESPKDEKTAAPTEPKRRPLETREPVTTEHELQLGDRTLKYKVTFCPMPIRDESGSEVEANIYFTDYTVEPDEGTPPRPLTFTYNGGPGSSSAWLHLGGIGPQRVNLADNGDVLAAPYTLVPNQETWLDFTDMVFIDPVGTGFSRAATPELDKKFWSIPGDLQSVAETIRLYLTRFDRWTSPLFLCGESYGTFRSAGLADHLFGLGVPLNGIVLVSTILNMQTSRFGTGNDLPYPLFLPTYSATAWYHGKLPSDLQSKPLRQVLDEVEAFAAGDYTIALMQGDDLEGNDYQRTLNSLARYTGLSEAYLDGTKLRINIHRFTKELLRDRRQTVGRIDSRFTGRDALGVTEFPDFDPSVVYPGPPYTATYVDYVRTKLGWETDQEFVMMSGPVGKEWDWGNARDGYPDTSAALRKAIHKYRYLKVLNMAGYYDFATPYYAAQYTLKHMGLDPEYKNNLEYAYYEAGHMMYIDLPSRQKMHVDAFDFFNRTLKRG
jgi:carboxypeptidase C (cathepsin A)